jgi:hypothetical protein
VAHLCNYHCSGKQTMDFFPHYLIHRKNLLTIKCLFWFSLQFLSQTFPTLRRIQRDIIINAHRSSCKVLIILVRFNQTWILLTDFWTILVY